MRKTVLIIGASSFVGSNLLESLKEDYRVVGTYYQTPVDVSGILSLPCDVLRKEAVQKFIDDNDLNALEILKIVSL